MNLHRATDRGEWEDVAPDQRNIWQRVAAGTRGILTLPNVITLTGLVIVGIGLYMITRHHYWYGLLWLAVGRGLDVVDGWAAERTGTKSPLGEALDPTVDKIGTAATLIVLVAADVAPWWGMVVLAMPQLALSFVSLIATRRGVRLHPSRNGKLGMFTAWISLLVFLLAAALTNRSLEVLSWISLAASVVFSTKALIEYVPAATGRRTQG